uniref:MADS-box domain-containing protein n=1 Tax=Setaria italica TaxID=4555 RepID=K3XZ29_SETIT
MGRGKVELKRIENRVSRQVTFSKRRKGLLKKAHELAVLCDVDVGVVVFSERGKLFEYPDPPASLTDLIRRYEAVNNTQLQETPCTDHQQQMIAEIGRLRREYQQLEANLMAYTGEYLSSVAPVDELDELERQLEMALSKVRARKCLCAFPRRRRRSSQINGRGPHDAAATGEEGMEEEMAEPAPAPSPSFAYLLNVNEKSAASTMLQLWPQTDGDDDDVGTAGGGSSSPPPPRGLQLW